MSPTFIGGLVIAAILALVALTFQVKGWEHDLRDQGYTKAKGEEAAARTIEEKHQRTIENDRTEKLRSAENANRKLVEKSQADARRAHASADGLRGDIADLRRRISGGDPAATGGGQAADAIGNILGECGARYSGMAKEADDARAAGLLCEQAYDALR